MFYGWPRRLMIGISFLGGLSYVGVYSASSFAKEPVDLHPVPLGAMLAPTTTIAISSGATFIMANMTGDAPIVQSKDGFRTLALEAARRPWPSNI